MNTKKGCRRTLEFGSERIDCIIECDGRDRLKITVYPDRRVVIKAPSGKAMPQILEKVRQRAGWILKQRHYFEQFVPRPPERTYVSGESFYYLGRQYRLKVFEDVAESVKLIGKFLRVHTSDKADTKRVKRLVDKWYREHASQVFDRRISACHESAKRYRIACPRVKLRTMRKRWGSCNGKGCILLNTQLVKAPLRCIDYVVFHELCHLKHPAHDTDFYRLLTRLLPDWKERKRRLEQVVF